VDVATARREQTSGESRDRILAAAAELFADRGYRQTTFADVAERSGISRGSIPWHFGSKEGLLLAVLERSVLELQPDLENPPAPGAAAEVDGDRMTQALGALFARPTTKLFVTLLVEALEPDSPIRDRYVALHDSLRGRCRRWLEQFPLPDGLPADALAVAVVGAGIGIHQQWLVAPDRVDIARSLGALSALVIAAIKPETGAAPR
jgi:TetR/AcrR family acrAB operon transcriptional repressor